MDVHPTKNGIFIGIDPYPYFFHISWLNLTVSRTISVISRNQNPLKEMG
jgi:hypothetical protein